MNKFAPLPQDPLDRIIADAVRNDMARVYGERREEPREPAHPVELPSVFMRRQAE
jgi:hypothetical protein